MNRSVVAVINRMVALGAAALAAGCMHPGPYDAARVGPFFVPANVEREPTIGGLRRVVVLPIWPAPPVAAESAASFDEIFHHALQKEHRFEVVVLTREECLLRFRRESLASSGVLPTDLLMVLKAEDAADGVLFLVLTDYSADKPISLGVRGKLATIDGARLLWTFDNVFAADDPAVANAARHHFIDRDTAAPIDMTPAVLQSPSRFAAYAAATMFETLPPVVPPAPPQNANSTQPRR